MKAIFKDFKDGRTIALALLTSPDDVKEKILGMGGNRFKTMMEEDIAAFGEDWKETKPALEGQSSQAQAAILAHMMEIGNDPEAMKSAGLQPLGAQVKSEALFGRKPLLKSRQHRKNVITEQALRQHIRRRLVSLYRHR